MDIAELRQKADAGSCVAQTILGIGYLYGYDVEVDYKEAFRYLSAAADQGASRALHNLGYMYAEGLGIPQDSPEGIRLFEVVGKPADSSDAFAARIALGRIYSRGQGIPVNTEAAVEWYSAALALATVEEDSDELREARDYVGRPR
jgi:uncharacterized protein